jgi:hypothetical protein
MKIDKDKLSVCVSEGEAYFPKSTITYYGKELLRKITGVYCIKELILGEENGFNSDAKEGTRKRQPKK